MSTLPKAYSFSEIKEIPLEKLITDRKLQRDIHYSIEISTREDFYVSENHPYNPNPVVVLKNSNSTSHQHDTFRIEDKEHIYFFSAGWPVEKVPDFLKKEDIIPSGSGYPFNKPLNRVKEKGGLPERYNSVKQEWEQFDNQKYQPTFFNKLKTLVGIRHPILKYL